jgi:hypothetical protein
MGTWHCYSSQSVVKDRNWRLHLLVVRRWEWDTCKAMHACNKKLRSCEAFFVTLGAVPFSVPGGGICDNGGMVVGLWQLSNCLFLNSRPGWTSGPGQTSQSLVSTYVSAHVLQMFGRSEVTVNLVVASHRYNALGVLYMCRCFARARRPSRKEGNFCFSGADLRAAVCICRDMSNYCLPSWREGF